MNINERSEFYFKNSHLYTREERQVIRAGLKRELNEKITEMALKRDPNPASLENRFNTYQLNSHNYSREERQVIRNYFNTEFDKELKSLRNNRNEEN